MSLRDKLNRYKVHLTKEEPKFVPVQAVGVPYLEKWAEYQAKPFVFDEEYVIVREVRYPLSYQHGKYSFAQLEEIINAWEESGIEHPLSAAGRNVRDLLFFDTETTGLHGGAGNTIFLLGYSRFEDDSVVVRQHFLADPHAEVALYHSFLTDVSDLQHMVTFNGKAFDWPQVKTRHTLLRDLVPLLPSFGHYDLLHASRRLWKKELESCRLSIIEQEKLGIQRKNDIPGHMAPILFFDYLHNQNPETIFGVLQHNQLDVMSLITLYIHISKLLLESENEKVSYEERFEIARWYETIGADEQALNGYKRIVDSDHDLRGKAKLAMGFIYKKQKAYDQALRIWEECQGEISYLPEELYIELAKLHEHHSKDYEKALHYTIQAFSLWKKKSQLLRKRSKADQTAYEKRIERLERKIDPRF